MTKQRHLRKGDHLDDDATVVIRGGRLEPNALRTDAQRYHDIYGTSGSRSLQLVMPPSMSWPSRYLSSGSKS